MSTAQTLALGALAGFTIFLGLPIGRMQSVKPGTKAFLAATATGILIFLVWDVLSQAVGPVEKALTDGRDGRFAWLAFLLAAGFLTSLLIVRLSGSGLHKATEGLGICAPLAGDQQQPSWSFLALLGLIGGAPTFLGTVVGQVWVSESVSILFFALAAGSILYVVMELLNVGRVLASKTLVTWGVLFGLFLGFGTDFILVAAGA